MDATTFFLTAAIALIAVADVGLALLSSALIKRGKRERFGFRTASGKRAALARSVCLACLVSLAIALLLVREELRGGNSKRASNRNSPSLCLALLLAFNIVANFVALYLSVHGQQAHGRSSGSLLPVTDPHCRDYGRHGSKHSVLAISPPQRDLGGSPSYQNEQSWSKNNGDYADTVCINVEAVCGKSAEASLADCYLDRRDSDHMLRSPAALRKLRLSMPERSIPETPFSKEPQEEELLDALMHDTVKVLVDC